MVKKIDKVISKISGALGSVSYVGIIVIMLIVVIDVLLRKLVRFGIMGSYELVERVLLIMIFAAFAYTQTHRGHIHVTLFLGRFPRSFGLAIFGLFGVLSTAACVFCAYAVAAQGEYSMIAGTVTAVLHMPLWPFYYIASFCMYVFALVLLWDAIKSFVGIADKEVGDDIRSSWE